MYVHISCLSSADDTDFPFESGKYGIKLQQVAALTNMV